MSTLNFADAQAHLREIVVGPLPGATAVETVPQQHHKEPFDRIQIAQAQIEGIPIVSVDGAFAPCGGLDLVIG
jgi:PIN domain nuclease of toxin-antitoxin system